VDQRWARVQCIIDSSINVIARLQHSKERQAVKGEEGEGVSERRRPLLLVWSLVWLIFNFIRTVGCRPISMRAEFY